MIQIDDKQKFFQDPCFSAFLISMWFCGPNRRENSLGEYEQLNKVLDAEFQHFSSTKGITSPRTPFQKGLNPSIVSRVWELHWHKYTKAATLSGPRSAQLVLTGFEVCSTRGESCPIL